MPPKKAAPKKAAPKKAAPKAAPKKAAAPKATPKKAAPKVSPKKSPAKRSRDSSIAAAAAPAKAAKTSAGTTATACARPPVDEHIYAFPGQVALDLVTGVPWAVKLNQTNIGHNNNKFYIIQLVEGSSGNYACFTRWGRVGETGQHSKDVGDRAAMEKAFEKKFKDKTRNDWKAIKDNHGAFTKVPGKYDLVETENADPAPTAVVAKSASGKPVAVKPSALEPRLQHVLSFILDRDMFKEKMREQNIDANRMPLGKLTKAQVERGYEALEAVEAVVKKVKRTAKDVENLKELSSRFYTIIPHDFGRMVPPVISTTEMVKTKFDLLDMLNDIQIAVAMDESAASKKKLEENPLDVQYREIGCKLEAVDPNSKEFSILDTYTKQTQGYRKCSIRNAFRVDRPQDKERMKAHAKEKGRYLLWHGTNVAVIAAILKTGLRIMPHAGGRVGKGLYFASENGKSSAYTGMYQNTGYMFLVEVCMGDNIHRITDDDSSLNLNKVNGLKVSSVLACGRQEPDPKANTTIKGEWGAITVPQGAPVQMDEYKSSSFLQSEYLIYEEGRARIKYMLEMNFK